jgi:hypothetical protein
MTDKDPKAQADWQAKLLQDIEAFARSPLDLGKAEAPAAPRESAGFPEIDPHAAPPAPAAAPVAAVSAPAPTPAAPAGGLLDKLKREAAAKQMTDSQIFTLQAQRKRFVSDALQMAYAYLNDLAEQLNVLKPAVPTVYNLIGLADMDGLVWQEGRADYRLKADELDDRFYEQVVLRYRLAAPRELRIERESPGHNLLRDALSERNITYKEVEIRNARNQLTGSRFIFPCEIKAGLAFGADYANGEVRLQLRNIQRFGALDYRLTPEAVDSGSLEELAHFILGEGKRIEKLLGGAR